MLPKISIITPSYNQGHVIEETITSILDQGYPNLEYIIMDGGSKDNTVEVIKKYEKHITHWTSERDKGQSDAINKGFRMATGDVINWLNSDDYYEKGALHKVGDAFADPSMNVYCGISRIFGNKGEYFSTGTDVYPSLEKTIGWARIDQPETFFRKKCLDEVGHVDEQFHYIMDKEMWARYLMRYGLGGIKKTNDLLAHFRIHDDSKTNNFNELFNKESFALFYTIATLNNSSFADYIKTLGNAEALSLVYANGFTGKDVNIDSVLNYFLLYIYLEKYAANDYATAKDIEPHIKEELLEPADMAHFKNIKLRLRIVPVGLKKLFNKLK
jgi:glycosyltransferase involved in cell wall biosynthesis